MEYQTRFYPQCGKFQTVFLLNPFAFTGQTFFFNIYAEVLYIFKHVGKQKI